jgi:putative glutamine amidotransferase
VTVSRQSGWLGFQLIATSVWLAGGRAVKWADAAQVDVDAVDGIIIGGGHPASVRMDDGRVALDPRPDRLRSVLDEWALKAAFADGKPVLGIGHGAVVLNEALGGSSVAGPVTAPVLARRRVRAIPAGGLANMFGPGPANLRAHREAKIQTLGMGMRIAARDEFDGIQAIRRDRDPFALGVLWHPEWHPLDRRQRSVFAALVAAANALADDRRTGRIARAAAENFS